MKTMDYGDAAPTPKPVEDTKMLEPNAGSPTIYETGTNTQERDTDKHSPFGKLGIKGLPK